MKNFGKYFLLILAFLSIGGSYSYGSTPAEVREEQSGSEDLRASALFLWAYRENSFGQYPDLSENHFYGSISVIPKDFSKTIRPSAKGLKSSVERDLRKDIFEQLFPKHFFW